MDSPNLVCQKGLALEESLWLKENEFLGHDMLDFFCGGQKGLGGWVALCCGVLRPPQHGHQPGVGVIDGNTVLPHLQIAGLVLDYATSGLVAAQ